MAVTEKNTGFLAFAKSSYYNIFVMLAACIREGKYLLP